MGGRYNDLPDFTAYENSAEADVNSHVVTQTQGAYGNYIFFDLGVYARSSPQEQSRSEEILLDRAAEKSVEARGGMQRLLNMAKEGATLQSAGGGTIIGGLDISVMDDRTALFSTRLESVYGREDQPTTFQQEQQYLEFTRHHENAHLMLDLREPGSDFMAATTFLKQHPEARDTIQTIADLRIVDGFKDGPGGLARYGMESYEAIQRALAIPPEQLKNASTEALYTIALEYDQKNEMNRSLKERSPEGQVFTVLNDRITGGANRSGLQASWDLAAAYEREGPSDAEKNRERQFTPSAIRDVLRNSELTGEARDIASATINAIDRLDAVVGPAAPAAPVPALQKNSAAPATP